ncbi:MAG: hypothetical protein ACI8P9_002624 [Parasphingorhabdus sp.]|jgi:hypothetical protein
MKQAIARFILGTIKHPKPFWLNRTLRYWKGIPRRAYSGKNKHSICTKNTDSGLFLDVYWLVFTETAGPSASLHFEDDELMRFDCLALNPHMHFNMKQTMSVPKAGSASIQFPSGSIEQHIDRAYFELPTNFSYARRTNINPAVRRLRVSDEELQEMAQWMKLKMLELTEAFGQAQDSKIT